MLYFTQPSTRTFLSFMAACQILGITCNEVRDPKTSSEVKRESKMDSIRMFSSYFDLIIMRTPQPQFSECCAYLMNQLQRQEMRAVPIINGGSGSDEHPTQALLDMYTIVRSFNFQDKSVPEKSRIRQFENDFPHLRPGPSGKTYAFCGDLGRGRTVRSLARALSQYDDVRMFFISPDLEPLRLGDDLKQELALRGVEFHEFCSLDQTLLGEPLLGQVDCLYMTRIQREHNSESDNEELEELDFSQFQLTVERAARMRPYVPILHPFPRDSQMEEIPVAIDADPRAMYFRQARNGMWARAALLVHLFGLGDDLFMLFEEFFRQGQPSDR